MVDETDRLLRQAYQDWLPYVTEAIAEPARELGSLSTGPSNPQVLKIVASATLTRDPSKIERLGLHCPRYIALGATDHRQAPPLKDSFYKVAVLLGGNRLPAASKQAGFLYFEFGSHEHVL